MVPLFVVSHKWERSVLKCPMSQLAVSHDESILQIHLCEPRHTLDERLLLILSSSITSLHWRCSVKCDVQSLVSASWSSSILFVQSTPPEHYGSKAGVPLLMTLQRRLKNRLCSSHLYSFGVSSSCPARGGEASRVSYGSRSASGRESWRKDLVTAPTQVTNTHHGLLLFTQFHHMVRFIQTVFKQILHIITN